MSTDKEHLGDGVYAAIEGDMLKLWTIGNVIYLEPEVIAELQRYLARKRPDL